MTNKTKIEKAAPIAAAGVAGAVIGAGAAAVLSNKSNRDKLGKGLKQVRERVLEGVANLESHSNMGMKDQKADRKKIQSNSAKSSSSNSKSNNSGKKATGTSNSGTTSTPIGA